MKTSRSVLVMFVAAVLSLVYMQSYGQTTQKINKKNLVIKEWNTDAKSKTKVLDHTTTYDPEGRKIEEIEYNSSGIKWIKRFEYAEGEKVSRELTYDAKRRLVSYKKFEYNEFGRKKTQYTYDAKGKLLTIKVFEYLTEDV